MRQTHIGSFVPAALHMQHPPEDKNIKRINKTIPKMFKRNGMSEGRKMTWRDFYKQLMP